MDNGLMQPCPANVVSQISLETLSLLVVACATSNRFFSNLSEIALRKNVVKKKFTKYHDFVRSNISTDFSSNFEIENFQRM